MSTKRTIARNVAVNQAGLSVNMTVAFFLMPFLLHRLGQTTYGLWILIGSMTSYFRLLDVGISSSVRRYVAHHKARKDLDGLNGTLRSNHTLIRVPVRALGAGAGRFAGFYDDTDVAKRLAACMGVKLPEAAAEPATVGGN